MAMPKSFIQLKLLVLWHILFIQFTTLALSLKLDGNCVASERDALLSFKEGIIDPLRLLASWEGQNCCSWRGVMCSNKTGHIIKLDLGGEDMRARYKLQCLSRCDINSSLLPLKHLNYLDLSYNDFTGQRLPEFIGTFKNLKYLNLSSAWFNDSIPPQLGNLSKLRYLDLSYNSLHSVDLVAWLPHLSSLEHLDMSIVNLSAAVYWVHAMSLLPASIRVLRLSECNLNATLSSFPLSYSSNLTALVTLDLSNNYFHGPIPDKFLQNMTSLKELDLGYNYLTGKVPETLKNLHKLEMLYLWGNGISGDIKELIERLPRNLETLHLWGNQISGDIEELIERLPRKIKSLFLGSNDLTGNLSWIEHMTGLKELDLSFNNLNGSIPFGMGKLTTLSYLDLSSNHLVGVISEDHFTSLTRLEELYLSNNSLTMEVDPNWIPPFRLKGVDLSSCKLGPHFPTWIRSQTNITSLSLSQNGIVDRLPTWFWDLISPIEFLDLSYNQISGELPLTLEFLSAAFYIILNSNRFQGRVPKLPVGLGYLDLSRNHISGPLPPDLGTTELGFLLLSNNHISGTIPPSICNQLQSLVILDLSNNHLSGQLPQCWTSSTSFRADPSESRQVGCELFIVSLYNNSLSGKFPLFFRGCQDLEFLDLSYNNFSGNLPAWIATRLPSLAFLLLKSNMFSGYIPVELAKLDHLQVLDLAHNNLSGTIAPSLMNFKAMTRISPYTRNPRKADVASYVDMIDSQDDSFSLFLVIKGQDLEYKTSMIYMFSLDLSSNNLIGKIPEQICALAGLKNLNLSSNRLTGNIPQSISGLRSLESLDLSNNELSGEIPSTLSDLTYLSYLNLSYNSLSGRIPTEGQLETFEDPTIYEGNNNLCGPPTSKDCSGNGTTLSDPQEYKDEAGMSSFYLSMGLGFAMGFWLIFGALLFKRTWRTAYFLFIDDIYDRIYVFMVLNWAKLIASIKEK